MYIAHTDYISRTAIVRAQNVLLIGYCIHLCLIWFKGRNSCLSLDLPVLVVLHSVKLIVFMLRAGNLQLLHVSFVQQYSLWVTSSSVQAGRLVSGCEWHMHKFPGMNFPNRSQITSSSLYLINQILDDTCVPQRLILSPGCCALP